MQSQLDARDTASTAPSPIVPNGTEVHRKEIMETSLEASESGITANPVSAPTNANQQLVVVTVNEYIRRFNEFRNKTAESHIKMGSVVCAAHTNLSDVQFDRFCKYIGFDSKSSTIRKFMKIGKQAELLSKFLDKLPSSWTSLYQLVQLDSAILESALVDGTITHDISGTSIQKLVAEHNPNEQSKSKNKSNTLFQYIYGKRLDTKVDEQVQRELDELIDNFFSSKKVMAA